MKIRGQKFTILKAICLVLYYCFLRYLPAGSVMFIGQFSRFYAFSIAVITIYFVVKM